MAPRTPLPAVRRAGRTATVVGGGPAGLIAAQVLATAGLVVTVHDHMPSVGRKLLLAGRGGLNLTHSEPLEQLLGRYGVAEAGLEGAVRAFGPAALRAWCADLGEPTFVGTSGRVFPASMRATPLLRALLRRLVDLGVRFELRDRWVGWSAPDAPDAPSLAARFRRADGTTVEVATDVTILALGGASWPRAGSDGGWVVPMRAAGVRVHELRAANCGVRVAWSDAFAARFAGVPLKNVAVRVGGSRDADDGSRGDAMVTAAGLEGGPVYARSAAIRRELDDHGRCTILVDLHPDLSEAALRARLDRRRPKESLATSLRRTLGLAPVAVALLREATGNEVPSSSEVLARLVSAVPVGVTAMMPIGRAISSAGGVALDEVNASFMLRRMPGTFLAGEMLDWEAPTGGYLLQASFSTGVAAARGALDWLSSSAVCEGPT